VSGGNILALLGAMEAFRRVGEQTLEAHGISGVVAEGWYPLDAYASALRDIAERIGPKTIYRVGQDIPKHITLPPGIDTFEAVAGSFGPAFAMNHRGAGVGGISHTLTGPRSARIVSGTPYPCDFDRGVIQGFFSALLKVRCVIEPDETAPCKSRGGANCTYAVRVQ
jgi:hypothetical protein